MKVSNAEAMKLIKELEARKSTILQNERTRGTVSYKEGEKKVETGYDYRKTREEMQELVTAKANIDRILGSAAPERSVKEEKTEQR